MSEKMREEQKDHVKNSVGRLIFAALSILLQLVWLVVLFERLNEYSSTIALISSIVAFTVPLGIYGTQLNAALKMPWLITLLLFPVLGLCLYGLFGHKAGTKKMQRRFEKLDSELLVLLKQDEEVLKQLEQTDMVTANQCRYIKDYAKYPVYGNTDIVFYADAAEGFRAQLAEIDAAKHFIFMEYHAIEEAESFGELKALLAKKAKEGVEIRLFYDDVGSIGFIDHSFIKRMNEIGVQCRVFNPIFPFFNLFMNNRDHRKITVIDGKVGFTGGYNLADEYFNIIHPYGHWKDTGIKLTGDAVRSLTVMFLEMWNACEHTDKDYSVYLPKLSYRADEKCFVQPYADSPLDDEYVGENVYLNLIKAAKKRLYVATPYLIISDEMNRELGLAAKRGVDVRILTPGIPDKKLIYKVTRSYYGGLVAQGVRIYEYTPGFLHEKQMICDDDCATVGTINMDYRSLYHHFENGVFLYRCDAIRDISKDFDDTMEKCTEVTENYKSDRSVVLRGTQCILRLFAPLL